MNPKSYSASTVALETFVQTKRRERETVCVATTTLWTLMATMDLVIHPSEGHQSDMLLDLSGLTREERVLVQASINNELFLQCLNLCFLTLQLSLPVNCLAQLPPSSFSPRLAPTLTSDSAPLT